MFIIAGLGNPGKEYENTRHNIGFEVIDALGDKWGIAINQAKHKGLYGVGYVNGKKVILLKPMISYILFIFQKSADCFLSPMAFTSKLLYFHFV